MSAGLLILRIVVGGLFIGHGTQKLFGWFGGAGPDGTTRMMAGFGYRSPRQMAGLAGATETASGGLLILGLFTPLAAAGIIGVMINAIASKAGKGLWNTNGGYELPLVDAVTVWAIAWLGAGAYSFDSILGINFSGTGAALIALFLGAVAAGFVQVAMRTARPADETIEIGRHRKVA